MLRGLDVSQKKERLLVFAAIISLVAIVTCIICDTFISKELDWSLIVAMSIIAVWLFIPVTIGKKGSVRNSLIVASLICIPFLFALSVILQKQSIVTLGGSIVFLACLSVWILYYVSLKMKGQPLLIVGYVFLLSIPLITGIVWMSDRYFNRGTNPKEVLFQLTLSLLFAGGCFMFSLLKKLNYE